MIRFLRLISLIWVSCNAVILGIFIFHWENIRISSITNELQGIPALSQAMTGQHGTQDENGPTYVEYGPTRGNDIGTGTTFYQRVQSPASRKQTSNFGAFGNALSDHYSKGLGLDDLSFRNWVV